MIDEVIPNNPLSKAVTVFLQGKPLSWNVPLNKQIKQCQTHLWMKEGPLSGPPNPIKPQDLIGGVKGIHCLGSVHLILSHSGRGSLERAVSAAPQDSCLACSKANIPVVHPAGRQIHQRAHSLQIQCLSSLSASLGHHEAPW